MTTPDFLNKYLSGCKNPDELAKRVQSLALTPEGRLALDVLSGESSTADPVMQVPPDLQVLVAKHTRQTATSIFIPLKFDSLDWTNPACGTMPNDKSLAVKPLDAGFIGLCIDDLQPGYRPLALVVGHLGPIWQFEQVEQIVLDRIQVAEVDSPDSQVNYPMSLAAAPLADASVSLHGKALSNEVLGTQTSAPLQCSLQTVTLDDERFLKLDAEAKVAADPSWLIAELRMSDSKQPLETKILALSSIVYDKKFQQIPDRRMGTVYLTRSDDMEGCYFVTVRSVKTGDAWPHGQLEGPFSVADVACSFVMPLSSLEGRYRCRLNKPEVIANMPSGQQVFLQLTAEDRHV